MYNTLSSKFLRLLQSSRGFTTFYSISSAASSNQSPAQIQADLSSKFKDSRLRLYLPPVAAPQSDTGRAVCFLVGWAGSKPKVMAKYASLYTDMGVPSIALAPTMPDVWFNKEGNKLSESVLSTLESLSNSSTSESPLSLILHIFSAGGYVVFPKLLDSLSNPDSILRTSVIPKCAIFDSGPTDFTYHSGFAASKLLLSQGAFNMLSYSIANTIGVLTNFFGGNQKRATLRSTLDSDLLELPQLYLHSSNDSVATYEWVSNIIQEQKEKGRQVSSHCWEETEHLRLYLEHKDEYTRCVEGFLKECQLL